MDWPATARLLHGRYFEAARQARDEAEKASDDQLRRDALTTAAGVWLEVANLVRSITDEASARAARQFADGKISNKVVMDEASARAAREAANGEVHNNIITFGEFQAWSTLLQDLDQHVKPEALEIPEGLSPWEAAVSFLRQEIGDDKASDIWERMENDRDWSVEEHMLLGMSVRNMLRRRGFNEGLLGVADLDDVWADLLREAVAPREQGKSPASEPHMTSSIQQGPIRRVVLCHPYLDCAPVLAHGRPTYFATIDDAWWYMVDEGTRPGQMLIVEYNENVEPGTRLAPTAFTYHFISSNGRVEEIQ